MTGENVTVIPNLSEYSTLPYLRSVEVSKEWPGENDWSKVIIIPSLSEYSTLPYLRSVEVSKE